MPRRTARHRLPLGTEPGPGRLARYRQQQNDWGLALFIDYGYTRRDYYAPYRNDGTLICHYRHRVHSDPFQWPGLTDISTSVDFTALAEAADDCGLDVCGYTTQAMFLLSSGLDAIMAGFADLGEAERLDMNNQVRRLTMPGEMGERFQVMALGRGLSDQLCGNLQGFSAADLRYRLRNYSGCAGNSFPGQWEQPLGRDYLHGWSVDRMEHKDVRCDPFNL